MLRCQECSEFSVIRLLDWGHRNLQTRIFSLASLPVDSARVFLRNMSSDYCDLSRKQQETEALYHSLNPVSHIVAIGLPDLVILDLVQTASTGSPVTKSATTPIRYPDWRTLTPQPETSPWFQLFDL